MPYMKAVRVKPNKDRSNPYSTSNPAPTSAIVLDENARVPDLREQGELLVEVMATSVTRDALTWPETYNEPNKILGNDFAGVVVAIPKDSSSSFEVGDKVYGMTHAERAGTWAEYVVVKETEATLKPLLMEWKGAAALPMSALTAYQALFKKAGLVCPDFKDLDLVALRREKNSSQPKRILITGASGAVGGALLNYSKCISFKVYAATRSTGETDLIRLIKNGADKPVSNETLLSIPRGIFDIIIDTVGGPILEHCWNLVAKTGTIISVHSSAFNFAKEHQNLQVARGKTKVKAMFFIVEPSSEDMEQISLAYEARILVPRVAEVLSLESARQAYKRACSHSAVEGKIVLMPNDPEAIEEELREQERNPRHDISRIRPMRGLALKSRGLQRIHERLRSSRRLRLSKVDGISK